jgi:hypothetical protein
VFAAYVTPEGGRALIDRELYLPKKWTADPDRCRAAAARRTAGAKSAAGAKSTAAKKTGVQAAQAQGSSLRCFPRSWFPALALRA